MKRIAILVPESAILGSLEGSRQLLSQVNQLVEAGGEEAPFAIELVGLTHEVLLSGGLFTAHAHKLIDDVDQTDLVIIPALDGDLKQAIAKNQAFVPWLVKQYEGGAELASLCMGAFLLAATGLVNGRQCATHWRAVNEFRQLFPEVNLVTEQIITDEKGIYSSGGAYSYMNLILYLIEKFVSRQMAVLIAKMFAIDIDRDSQAPFAIFQGQKSHADEPVKRAQTYIETNFQDRISVEELADMLALSRRSLERRFKKATSNTINEYIQRVKIEAAKQHFETNRKNINEVMFEVGYADTKSFRTVFKKVTGLSPTDYRSRYNREDAVLD